MAVNQFECYHSICSQIASPKLHKGGGDFNQFCYKYVYNHSMNVWSQVITEVEINCAAATQDAHNINLYILFNKRRRLANEGLVGLTGDTGRELGYASNKRQMLSNTLRPSPG